MQKKLLICHILYIIFIVFILININNYYECNCKNKENFNIDEIIKDAVEKKKTMTELANLLTNTQK